MAVTAKEILIINKKVSPTGVEQYPKPAVPANFLCETLARVRILLCPISLSGKKHWEEKEECSFGCCWSRTKRNNGHTALCTRWKNMHLEPRMPSSFPSSFQIQVKIKRRKSTQNEWNAEIFLYSSLEQQSSFCKDGPCNHTDSASSRSAECRFKGWPGPFRLFYNS